MSGVRIPHRPHHTAIRARVATRAADGGFCCLVWIYPFYQCATELPLCRSQRGACCPYRDCRQPANRHAARRKLGPSHAALATFKHSSSAQCRPARKFNATQNSVQLNKSSPAVQCNSPTQRNRNPSKQVSKQAGMTACAVLQLLVSVQHRISVTVTHELPAAVQHWLLFDVFWCGFTRGFQRTVTPRPHRSRAAPEL